MDRANDITTEIFTAVAQIRRADERSYPMPEVLHGRMRSFVDAAMRKAADLGFPQQDVYDIGYVLVGLVDEVVVAKGGELRDFWLPRLLQLQYFNENVAGEGVFDRLQNLLGDPARIDVLKIYYLVLLYGFQGKYRVRGGEMELSDVTDRVAETLRRAGQMREVELSPEGKRPKDKGGSVRRNLPLIAISLGALVFALIVFLALQLTISSRAGTVVDQIQRSSQAMQ
jgi:type VI secretion system protein ImpK